MQERAETPLHETDVADSQLCGTFEAFFQAQHVTLFRRLCLITGTRSDAEELSQDAFVRLWERWDRVSGLDDPEGYLYRTAMNLVRRRYGRTAAQLRRLVGAVPDEDPFVRSGGGPR